MSLRAKGSRRRRSCTSLWSPARKQIPTSGMVTAFGILIVGMIAGWQAPGSPGCR